MAGETNLQKLIEFMHPELHTGEYVFSTLETTANIPRDIFICEFREEEGVTVVLKRSEADKLNLTYEYIASWITLTVHSSLNAIGLTAVFSNELAKNNISCNVIAGYYHDHIFVDKKDAQKALKLLKALSKKK
ncbi:MAG: ACT domain-containing protein [Bacteroidota bacterium]